MIVPYIHGCGVQWKAYVPALANVKLNDPPGWMNPESNAPLSDVAV